ncbi:MAG: molybdopterin-dependent oxidoreductase [Proteobacteria bacterium]|nr:molybdopterin-dependent oxidoreductase [Pseudomonadota bacterium]
MNKSSQSRRDFIKNIGLASSALVIGLNTTTGLAKIVQGSQLNKISPNIWITLHKNGETHLIAHRSEMGQGIRTSLVAILADEMEADLSRVVIQQATGDKKYGNQNTDGSRSIRTFGTTLRTAGASVKELLIQAAAKSWKLPVKECYAESHYVYHKNSDKKIFYGDLIEQAKTLELPQKPTLKKKSEFKYIGTELDNLDNHLFVTGKAVYGVDTSIDGMVYASIQRTPVLDGVLKSLDKTETLKFPGVIDVVEIKGTKGAPLFNPLAGVAVIASNSWAAEQGKLRLKLEWDEGEHNQHNSEQYKQQLFASVKKKGKAYRSDGDAYKIFIDNKTNTKKKTVEALYYLPYLAHAPLETPAALAWVQADKCEVWASTQTPQNARTLVAKELGFKEEQVTINVTFLGAAFGRKSKPDYVVEAAKLSKHLNKPVKIFWSREDDIKHDYYHSVSAQYHQASIDENNHVDAWLHRSDFPPIGSTFNPAARGPGAGLSQAAATIPYDIKNVQVEAGDAQAHVRIGWLRAVYSVFHGFSTNCFADELAHHRKIDPLQHQLELIGPDRVLPFDKEFEFNTARLKKVLTTAAKNANWGKKLPKGHGMGIAVQYSFYSYIAQVVEVSVIDGKLKVHNINTCIDCGLVANMDAVTNQMQGSGIFGLSLAMYGEITAKDGKIEQSNFHNYKLLRMKDAPHIDVEVLVTDNPSTGVGEPAVPPLAPALCNAIFAASGQRYRELPLSKYGLC